MGTRNLTCVVANGEYKVAQYGQWDGYPTGQGNCVVTFLRTTYNADRFRTQINKIKHLTNDEVKARWTEAGAPDDDNGFVSWEIATKFGEMFPQLSRDCGAEVLEYIQGAEQPEVRLEIEFAADSLFCEFAYVVNLDTNELEVFKGFSKTPTTPEDRFHFLAAEGGSKRGYWPVKLLKKYRFDELTEKTMEELEASLREENEEIDEEDDEEEEGEE